MIKKLFISRELTADSKIISWATSNNFDVIAHSLIKIVPVLDLKIPRTDWIFFSSPKGAIAYLNNYKILAKKIGVLGIGTAQPIIERGIKVDFIGEASHSPEEIAKCFQKALNINDTIFLPISQRSKKSVLKVISKTHQTLAWVTYKTNFVSVFFDMAFDAMIFTSPSNLESYLVNNTIPSHAQIISIGQTTANTYKELNLKGNLIIADSPTEEGLILALENLK
ncbi:uroporphyrinogen-III synthase [Crocinitomix catalasitica]|uniref:uroporphyrinogen-III synthase n=1 Tax=Crocinitomix catalasitica TaxID=184607 RepID=UPI000565ADA9|nr:uroporphyrinogen-III synthase [Crocinitomix catalasitica]